jgi:hypothetical protein
LNGRKFVKVINPIEFVRKINIWAVLLVDNVNGLILETKDSNRTEYASGWCSECSSNSNDKESKEEFLDEDLI